MNIQATQIRGGMILIQNGELHRVHESEHRTPGNLRAFMQVKMRNLRTGAMMDYRYSASDRVEKATLDTHDMEYLYSDPSGHHFMNQETYDQISMTDEMVGDAMRYLLPNTVVKADFYDGNPIAIELPNTVTLKVVETQPGMKGATASASYKPATLETGLVVQVPQFVEAGTTIKIDTRDDKYLERV